MREPPKCRKCGRVIKFVQTSTGRYMPVDSFSVAVIPRQRGSVFYLEDGTQIRGRKAGMAGPDTVTAYEPHWGTCSGNIEAMRKTPRYTGDEALKERIRKEREEKARKEAERAARERAEQERREAQERQYCLFANRG